MKPYPVICYGVSCGKPAEYKVASRWSDGQTAELKTYFLSCETCLPALFREAKKRRQACRLTADETLETPSIFDRIGGEMTGFRNHRRDLEEKLLSEPLRLGEPPRLSEPPT